MAPEADRDGIEIGCEMENEFRLSVIDAALWNVETIELAESPWLVLCPCP